MSEEQKRKSRTCAVCKAPCSDRRLMWSVRVTMTQGIAEARMGEPDSVVYRGAFGHEIDNPTFEWLCVSCADKVLIAIRETLMGFVSR